MMQAEGRVTCRRSFVTLVIGISIGFSFAYILFTSPGFSKNTAWHNYRESLRNLEKHPIIGISEHSPDEPAHKDEDRTVADELFKKVRVLCWIMTQPKNHKTIAKHVKATWGKRCNKLLFMSTEEDPTLPAVKLPVTEGRDFLWGKTKAAFRYVYEHHRRDADWFMKADDDTYVVVENLRYMLADYDPNDPIYFGCRFKPFAPQGYMSGGAGYVLSSKALDKFVNEALSSPTLCPQDDDAGPEDAEMGVCLDKIGVRAMDSRDEHQRGRFFPFVPEDHLFPIKDTKFWYWSYLFYPTDEGLDCCSDHAVTFHYISTPMMYVLDYLIYHLRPYGIKQGSGTLPKLLGGSNATKLPGGSNATKLLGGNYAPKLPGGSNATKLPGGSNATKLPGGYNTTKLLGGSNATKLPGGSNATKLLGGSNATKQLGSSNVTKLLAGSNATIKIE